MNKLTKEEVRHFGKLANLDLTENEQVKFGNQLRNILDFVEKIDKVNTSTVCPLNHVTGKKNVLRNDGVQKSLSPEEALANAPSTHKGYFKIKAIFEK